MRGSQDFSDEAFVLFDLSPFVFFVVEAAPSGASPRCGRNGRKGTGTRVWAVDGV